MRMENTVSGDKLIVEDTSMYVIQVPVKLKDKSFITKETSFILTPFEGDSTYTASLLDINPKIEIIDGQRVFMAKLLLDEPDVAWSTGLPVSCTISNGKIRLLEYLKQSTKK